MQIHYNISPFHQMEPDMRLADSMLYAALKSELGDRIQIFSSLQDFKEDGPLWGMDHYDRPDVLRRRAAAYRDPAVLAAIEGVIVPAREAGAVMDEISARGISPAMRSMADPIGQYYVPGAGGQFDKLKDRIRVKSEDEDVLIHPAPETLYERRYMIVAGEIAAEGPCHYCSETPALLLDPANRNRSARNFWEKLEDADPHHLELQRAAVEDLLARYPMTSGAIDVGIAQEPSTDPRALVGQVWAAAPGGALPLFADPIAYAGKIAAHLHVLEPDIEEVAGIAP